MRWVVDCKSAGKGRFFYREINERWGNTLKGKALKRLGEAGAWRRNDRGVAAPVVTRRGREMAMAGWRVRKRAALTRAAIA